MISEEIRESQEFQSALMRLGVWGLMVTLVGLAGWTGYYTIDRQAFYLLFGLHLAWYVGILVSTILAPATKDWRTYLGIVADLSGTTWSIYLSGYATSPFYLLYIWSFLSQGTRYGKRNLIVASAGSVLCFGVVGILLGSWASATVEMVFMLIALIVLPVYQFSLLQRLHRTRQAAETANRARGNFLATMTHELRTPLSGMIGMAGLLGDTHLDDEQRDCLDSINTSARVLQALIGDILDLSKIDAGKLELRNERFDVREALLETCSSLSSQSLGKGVELVLAVAPDVPEHVYGDELRFRQILFNLIGNAVKFTVQGQVRVVAKVAAADHEIPRPHLGVSVIDTGVGIEREKLTQIFDSFWQADSSTTRSFGGTGLGTTIARDLVRLMRGVIGVESIEGEGSTFWIKLPLLRRDLAMLPQPPQRLRDRRALIIENSGDSAQALADACTTAGMQCEVISDLESLSGIGRREDVDILLIADTPKGIDLEGLASMLRAQLRETVPVVYLHYRQRKIPLLETNAIGLSKPFISAGLWRAMASALAGEPMRGRPAVRAVAGHMPLASQLHVLVAEDDNVNSKLIQILIVKMGHRITLVRDGEAAYACATREHFDLALIDLRMPKMDGIEFTRRYRENEGDDQHLPIIALTANAAEDARLECLAAGMDDFLTKPIDPLIINRVLSRYSGSALNQHWLERKTPPEPRR